MSGFAASNLLGGTQQALTTTFKTLLNLSAATATLRRARVHEFVFGTDGTPADNVMTYDVSRTTAIGIGTSVTPTKLDNADGVSGSIGTANHTSEPTVTATSNLWSAGMNQRATHRWVAFPGSELVVPAVNAEGLAFRAKSPGYTGTGIAQVHWTE